MESWRDLGGVSGWGEGGAEGQRWGGGGEGWPQPRENVEAEEEEKKKSQRNRLTWRMKGDC